MPIFTLIGGAVANALVTAGLLAGTAIPVDEARKEPPKRKPKK